MQTYQHVVVVLPAPSPSPVRGEDKGKGKRVVSRWSLVVGLRSLVYFSICSVIIFLLTEACLAAPVQLPKNALELHLLILPPDVDAAVKSPLKSPVQEKHNAPVLLKDITKQLDPKSVVRAKNGWQKKLPAAEKKNPVLYVKPFIKPKTNLILAKVVPSSIENVKEKKTPSVTKETKKEVETTVETVNGTDTVVNTVIVDTSAPVDSGSKSISNMDTKDTKVALDTKTDEFKLAQLKPKDLPVPVSFLPAEEKREIQLVVGESKVISAFGLIRTAIGNPVIADVVVVSNHELLLNGKFPGTTTLTLWDKRGRLTYIITVYKEPLSTQTKIFPLQYLWLKTYKVESTSSKVSSTISANTALMGEIDKTLSLVIGKDSYSINSELNNIVIQGTGKDLEKAESVLKQIDIPETQILVEAKVVEVSEDDLKTMGITWNINKEKVAVQYDTTGGQFKIDTLGALSEQYIAKINALQNTGKANLLANPKIGTVLHGDPGMVFLGDSVPITIVTKDASGNTLQSTSYVDIGVNLFFLPTKVSDNGYVTMFVLTSVTTISGFNAQGSPNIKGNSVRTEIRIKDGEAVVIGGLLRSEEVESMQKVPYLADLPFLGNFFKNKRKTIKKNEMIVIFTPHILRGTETVPASLSMPGEPK